MHTTRHAAGGARRGERGFTIVYMAVFLTTMLLFTGLALDGGRAYVVKAQLSKAVDGAALGAARNLNSGNPRAEAVRIFRANFPDGYMGTTLVTDPATDPGFFAFRTDAATGVNIITINATAELPTTFMRLADFRTMHVRSTGEATRRMVDLSLVLDVSSSIGSRWSAVRDAARTFVGAFDDRADRLALVLFSNGAQVVDQMPSGRGFDKAKLVADIPNSLPGGSTQMVEGLYRGWDELRTVANGQQSGLRVIVLFTDGASNGVPGIFDASGTAKSLRTYDFPKNLPDPDNQTWDNPQLVGFYHTGTGAQSPSAGAALAWNSTSTLSGYPLLPERSTHAHRRSSGIPTSFPLQTNTVVVDGQPQDTVRGLRNFNAAQNRYPADIWNTNNAARNLVEQIAQAARTDASGDYPIRIFTIGMGELVRYNLGTRPETSESMLMRMANDPASPDHNPDQLDGKYYFAQTGADVGPAFQALQSQIVRLSK